MPGEGLALALRGGAAVQPARPVQVHTGLTDGHHARLRRQLLDLGPRGVGQGVGPGGVQGHRGVDPVVPLGCLSDPPRRVEIVGDGHHRRYPHRRGPIQDGVHVPGRPDTARVQMGVRVDQRRQRFRGRWRLTLRTLATHRHTLR